MSPKLEPLAVTEEPILSTSSLATEPVIDNTISMNSDPEEKNTLPGDIEPFCANQIDLESPSNSRARDVSNIEPTSIIDFRDSDVLNNIHKSRAPGAQRSPIAFFVNITVHGRVIKALIDSGASRSFIGPNIIQWLESLGTNTQKIPPRRVIIANGDEQAIDTLSSATVLLEQRPLSLEFLWMPSLSQDCILGLDFLKIAGMVVDFADHTWHYRDSGHLKYQFLPESSLACTVLCNGLMCLEPSQQEELTKFLDDNLVPAPEKLPCTTLTFHDIDVGDHPPIRQKSHHVTPIILQAMWEEVARLLKEEIIEPSDSDWASPVVMIKKSNGQWRFCIDFRKVNTVSKKDAYPIPNMVGILDQLRQAHYITTLDLSQAYFQIPMAEKARPITAFIVPGRGLFQFKRMPFGLSNAPATMQRFIEKILGPQLYPHVFVYLDDIIIVATTFDEHLKWLKIVLDKIKAAGLTLNREKSEFCRTEVSYLGFIVNRTGLQVDPAKTAPVVEFPAPRNIKQLRRFLGMASWYRRFIPDFATVAVPLQKLTRKSQSWTWSEEQETAFNQLKDHLTTAPTLSCPDFTLPFSLQTDASSVGLGAVLTQVIDGNERVIAYASRALSGAEKNYTVTEQECLAVVWSIRKFRCYLEGYEFTVITDHSSLRWLYELKNPTGRLARWALELLEYNFHIVHRKGALHHVPDALSRIPESLIEAYEPIELRKIFCESLEPVPDDCLSLITEDAWYNKRLRDVRKYPEKFPDWFVEEQRLYIHRPNNFQESEIHDLNPWKLVLCQERRHTAIEQNHSVPQAGHLGVEKTVYRLSTNYYWPQMFRDVAHYIRHCQICQQTKVEQAKPAGFMGKKTVEQPWDTIAADVMGPFPRSKEGFVYVLIIQDLYTKWIEIQALKKSTGSTISRALIDLVFSRWGTPRVLLTDNGTEFVNKDMKSLATEYGYRQLTTPLYHPQADPVERVNRVVRTMMIAFIEEDHTNWGEHLHDFRFAHNTAQHSSTLSSPAFLNFGREPSAAMSLRREVEGEAELVHQPAESWLERMKQLDSLRNSIVHALEAAYRKQAQYYNARRRPREFEVQDLVWKKYRVLSNKTRQFSAKLTPQYHGPFKIHRKISAVVYELSNLHDLVVGKYSVQDLKPYFPPL